MELVQVGTNTYYIKNPTNIGIYKINDNDLFIILLLRRLCFIW